MPGREIAITGWDERTADDCRHVIRLAVREDLDRGHDLTTMGLVACEARGTAHLVFRQPAVIAGLAVIPLIIEEMNLAADWSALENDGTSVAAGTRAGTLAGSTRDILASERILLNFVGRLSGIATLTDRYVRAVAGTRSGIYDTRKTTPGWRRLEKYAVRCGGGRNHRMGLYDAVLIKDNHLAQAAGASRGVLSPSEAVLRARHFLGEYFPNGGSAAVIMEVEVDSLSQFEDALRVAPDIILLDNMSPAQIRDCVDRREAARAAVQLEASGGITLDNVRAFAEAGVERISVGAITHSATAADVALDWAEG